MNRHINIGKFHTYIEISKRIFQIGHENTDWFVFQIFFKERLVHCFIKLFPLPNIVMGQTGSDLYRFYLEGIAFKCGIYFKKGRKQQIGFERLLYCQVMRSWKVKQIGVVKILMTNPEDVDRMLDICREIDSTKLDNMVDDITSAESKKKIEEVNKQLFRRIANRKTKYKDIKKSRERIVERTLKY